MYRYVCTHVCPVGRHWNNIRTYMTSIAAKKSRLLLIRIARKIITAANGPEQRTSVPKQLL